MRRSLFEEQLCQVTLGMGANAGLRKTIARAHAEFDRTLDEMRANFGQSDEIADQVLMAFVMQCESQKIDDHELHLMIAVVRIALIRSGRDPNTLTDLRAPRKRKRVRNSEDGRYRFQLFALQNDQHGLADRTVEHALDDGKLS